MALRATVAICTRNRMALLERALRSMEQQTLPKDAYEVLVVDNASTDGTQGLVEGYTGGSMVVRYCYEPVLGVSSARNRSIREAQAPIVAFLDDDAVAEPGWLAAILSVFNTDTRRPLIVGGRVELEWESPPPAWLPPEVLTLLGSLDHGAVRHDCEFPKEVFFGTNMAFDRDYSLRGPGFDTKIGRRGSNLVSNEELAIQWRMFEDGAALVYEPSAAVRHWVPNDRLRHVWMLRRMFDQGRSDVRSPAPAVPGAEPRPFLKSARRYLRQNGRRIRRLLTRRRNHAYAMHVALTLAYDLGRVTERTLCNVSKIPPGPLSGLRRGGGKRASTGEARRRVDAE
jgi:glycosyltransferase involved in cell wall biosynthesis